MNSNPLIVCYPKLHTYFPPVYLLASVVAGKRCSELAFLGKPLLVICVPAGGHREPRRDVPGDFSFGNCLWADRLTSWDQASKKKGFFFPESDMASVIRGKLIRREITDRNSGAATRAVSSGGIWLVQFPENSWFAPGAVKGWKCSHCCNKYSFISDLSNAGGALCTLS